MTQISEEDIRRLAREAEEAARAASSRQELEGVRVSYLGREGKLTLVLRGIGQLPAEARPPAGKAANEARGAVADAQSWPSKRRRKATPTRWT